MKNRLRELRKSKGLLQKDIANILSISVSTYSYWEMGKFDIDLKSLQSLADYFNVSIDYILCRDSIVPTNKNAITIMARNGSYDEIILSDEDLEMAKNILKAIKEKNKTEPKDF